MAGIPSIPPIPSISGQPTPAAPTPTATTPPQAAIGTRAISPADNINTNKPALPLKQAAPRDISDTYANVGGTIYNKKSQAKFANKEDFFKDSGLGNFNVKFDTAYTPSGKETVFGQPVATQQTAPSTAAPAAAPAPVPGNAEVNNNPPTGQYTPPNQGTTGVSQGGIVGNLLNFAQKESPEVTKARAELQALQGDYGQQSMDINSRPEGLTQQTGQQGLLAQLFATKQNAAQTALSSALTSQGQQISATQGAGSLNAPQFTTPGAVQVSPTAPIAAGGNLVGGNTALNPLSNVDDTAQKVINGQLSYNDALAAGGTIPNFTNVLQQAISKLSPGFNFNTAQGQSAGQQSNAQTSQTIAVNAAAAAYPQYFKDYTDTKATVDSVDQFGSLLTSGMVDQNGNTINPSDVKWANQAISTIRGLLSSQQQAQFDTTFAALKSKISGLLAVGGSETPTQLTADANSILSGSAPLGTLQATLDRIKQEGQVVVNLAAQKGNTALSQAQGSGNGSTAGNMNVGGFNFVQNAQGQWVAQ